MGCTVQVASGVAASAIAVAIAMTGSCSWEAVLRVSVVVVVAAAAVAAAVVVVRMFAAVQRGWGHWQCAVCPGEDSLEGLAVNLERKMEQKLKLELSTAWRKRVAVALASTMLVVSCSECGTDSSTVPFAHPPHFASVASLLLLLLQLLPQVLAAQQVEEQWQQ